LELVGAFASVAPPGYVPAVAVMLARPLHVSKSRPKQEGKDQESDSYS